MSPVSVKIDRETIVAEGTVLSANANGTGQVRMPNGHELTAFLTGKMRDSRIPLLQGEKVMLEISPYDLSRGRIVASGFAKKCEMTGDLKASSTSFRDSDQKVATGEVIPSGGFGVP